MERSIQFLMTLVAAIGLSACAMGERRGPPAPIVRLTPPEEQPARPRETQADREAQARREAAQEKPPAKPAKPKTQVYAYKDPNALPEVEPSAPAPSEPASPTRSSGQEGQTHSAPSPQVESNPKAPAGSATAPSQVPAQQQVAKAEPRLEPPASVQSTPEPAPVQPPPPALPPSTVSAPSLPPASETLASQAERQRQSGDYAGAAASLERSLRISPREAYLWNRLARVRMEQGQAVQAGTLAARSNDLAGDNADLRKDNWRIIAESRRRAGDVTGAGEAEQRAGVD